MKGFVVAAFMLISAVAAVEEVIPRIIYSKKSFCSGENFRLSCSDDGAPFLDYQVSVVGINIFSSEEADKECRRDNEFSRDEQLCPIDYLADEASEFTELGLKIQNLCEEKKECFVSLPRPHDLSSSDVCGGKGHFYAITVEFTCKEPSVDVGSKVYKTETMVETYVPAVSTDLDVPEPFEYDYEKNDAQEEQTTKTPVYNWDEDDLESELLAFGYEKKSVGNSASIVTLTFWAGLLAVVALLV